MSVYCATTLQTQNDLIMNSLTEFYENTDNLQIMIGVINGETKISLRIIDWFVTNYAKKNYTIYEVPLKKGDNIQQTRFKVFNDYKLKLKSYSKKRFDPFCRWGRISVPFNDKHMETTIGQLNFFKWAIENNILDYIRNNYDIIEKDMNSRNSTSRSIKGCKDKKTRKKREELSIHAVKSIKKESIDIIVKFD